MLSECTDPATLNAYVFARAQVTDYKGNVAPANTFTKVKTLLGSYSCHELPTSIQNLHESFQAHSSKSTQPRIRAAKRIGFQTPSDITNNSLRPIILSKLSTPYPTPKAYVLERSEPIPDPPKVTDTSCGKCDLLIPIDESKLQYTLPANESAIIRDRELPDNIVVQRTITILLNLGLSISSRIPSIGEHYLNEMGQENWQRWE